MGKLVIGENDLITWCKNNGELGIRIMDEWLGLNDLGQPINIENYSYGSFKEVQWKCKEGHVWSERIYYRTVKKWKCPICKNKNNRLVDWINNNGEYGQLILSEWVGIQNDGTEVSIKGLKSGSNKIMKWRCKEGHEWEEMVYERTHHKRFCPECSNRKNFNTGRLNTLIIGVNDLHTWCQANGERGKQLEEEWNQEANGISTSEIVRSSHTKYWWKCNNCGDDFEMNIAMRTYQGSDCPKCSHKMGGLKNHLNAINNNQDFETWCVNNGEYGELLLKEWDEQKNRELLGIEKNNITKGSDKKVYWKCSYCGESFQARVIHRVYNRCKCNKCNSQGTSLPEQFIYKALKQIYPNIISRGKAFNKVEFDICIPDEKLCIEYNSEYWHKDREEKDNYKRNLCDEYNVRLLQIYGGQYVKDELYSNNIIRYNIPNSYEKHINILKDIINYIVNILGHNIDEINLEEALKEAYESIYVDIEDSIVTTDWELLQEWDSELLPRTFKRHSHKRIKWKCTMCGKSWETSIRNRTYYLSGCPHCGYNIFDNTINEKSIKYRDF